MRVFVTGATGVVGSRLLPLLIQAGHEVTGVARSAERAATLTRLGARPAIVDLFDRAALDRELRGHDAVVNLATHVPSSSTRMLFRRSWRENDRIRTVASGILVDAAMAVGVRRFVQESFAPIYEDAGDRWIDEQAAVRPAAYNASVLDAERSAERFTGESRTGVVLRFAYFYGPDSGPTRDLIAAVRKGWAPLFGRADAYMSSVSHDDAAAAVAAALAVAAGTYNVTDDEPLRRREFVDALARMLGVGAPRLPPAWLARLAGGAGETLARSLRISNRKLRAASGWAPKYRSVREGWAAVVAAIAEPQS